MRGEDVATGGAETCCFCGAAFGPYVYPDRDVTGRVAHFRCSEKEWAAGTWTMAPVHPMADYEEGDDGRAWESLNILRWPGRGVGA